MSGGLLLAESLSRVSQRGSERRCSAIVSGGAARSRLELSHAPTSTSIHLPAFSASDRFLVWTIRPGYLPPPLPALNPINNAVGSRLRVTAILPTIPPSRSRGVSQTGSTGNPRASSLTYKIIDRRDNIILCTILHILLFNVIQVDSQFL